MVVEAVQGKILTYFGRNNLPNSSYKPVIDNLRFLSIKVKLLLNYTRSGSIYSFFASLLILAIFAPFGNSILNLVTFTLFLKHLCSYWRLFLIQLLAIKLLHSLIILSQFKARDFHRPCEHFKTLVQCAINLTWP